MPAPPGTVVAAQGGQGLHEAPPHPFENVAWLDHAQVIMTVVSS